MKKLRSRAFAAVLGLALGVSVLTGCGAETAVAPEKPNVQSTKTPEVSPTPQAEPVSQGGTSEWASPVSSKGDLLGMIMVGSFTVKTYQMPVVQATATGNLPCPDPNFNITAGADIIYLNYVVTNSGAAINLGPESVKVDTIFTGWPFDYGLDFITDPALEAQVGVSSSPFLAGVDLNQPSYVFSEDSSINFAQNLRYYTNTRVTTTFSITPVDPLTGEYLYDKTMTMKADAATR